MLLAPTTQYRRDTNPSYTNNSFRSQLNEQRTLVALPVHEEMCASLSLRGRCDRGRRRLGLFVGAITEQRDLIFSAVALDVIANQFLHPVILEVGGKRLFVESVRGNEDLHLCGPCWTMGGTERSGHLCWSLESAGKTMKLTWYAV